MCPLRGHRTTTLLTLLFTKQKRHPFGCLFLYGGDKRDRTADLMTASCDRFVIWSVFASNTSVLSTKSAGFCKTLSAVSTRFRAHLGHNLGQAITLRLKESCGALMHHRSRSRRSQVFSDDVSNPSIKYYYLEKFLNRF